MTNIEVITAWQTAANEQNAERLLELSEPEIQIVGPRGIATGHEILREWLKRAGLTLETRQLYARENNLVADQHGIWRDSATGEIVGEADVATHFRVNDGRVTYLARYDSLEEALQKAELTKKDTI
jgi:hypothetical protein